MEAEESEQRGEGVTQTLMTTVRVRVTDSTPSTGGLTLATAQSTRLVVAQVETSATSVSTDGTDMETPTLEAKRHQLHLPLLLRREALERAQYAMDRGRSWAVLAGGFLTFFLQAGFITSFGLYVDIFSEEFGVSDAAAALTPGIAMGVMTCTTIVGAVVYRMLGSRCCILIGGSWATLGFLSAASVQTLLQAYASVVAIGLGFSFNLISVSSVQVDYFDKYRLFALAFQSVGASVGTTVIPHLLYTLNRAFGWRSALVVVGGINAAFIVIGCILASRQPRAYATPFSEFIQVRLLKRKTFLAVLFNIFLCSGASYSFFFFETKFTRYRGLDRREATMIVSVVGGCNIVGRLVASVVVIQECTNLVLFYSLTTLVWSLAILGFTLPTTTGGLAAVGGIFGLGFGLMYPSLSPVLLELFGVELVTTTLGFGYFFMGLGACLMPFLKGEVVMGAGYYEPGYYFTGCCGLLAATIAVALAAQRAFRGPGTSLTSGALQSGSPSALLSTRDSLRVSVNDLVL